MKMFFVNGFLLFTLCAAQISEISQPESLQTVKIGDSATIKCYIKSIVTRRVWYRVTADRKLQLVVTTDAQYDRTVFSDGFNQRYSVKFDWTSSNLSISPTSWEDVGTYFCGVLHLNEIQFGSGTFLMLKGAKTTSDSVIQQPESQSVRSGDSVTLSCSVHSRQCTAEHTRVAWLKNSDHSAPEMIYSSEKNICQKTDSEKIICEYDLHIRSRDDAGAYYCAVSSCGELLFGNGTKIGFEHTINDHKIADVSERTLACIIITIPITGVYLAFTVCMISKRNCCHCKESHFRFSAPSEVAGEENLKIKRANEQRDGTWSECVYFSVKPHN